MRPLQLLPAVLLLATPAAAQTENPAPSEKCRVQPAPQQDGQQKPPAAGESLTETLDPCDGVLKPPPTGDRDITAQPPDQGKMPIIKPGEVPAQPPKQD